MQIPWVWLYFISGDYFSKNIFWYTWNGILISFNFFTSISALLLSVFHYGLWHWHHNLQSKYHPQYKKFGRSLKISPIFHWKMSPADTTLNGSQVNLYPSNLHAKCGYRRRLFIKFNWFFSSGLIMGPLPILLLNTSDLKLRPLCIYFPWSTVSKMSVEIILKCKNELLLKMGIPPALN